MILKHRSSGFTLIEMLIVIIIIGTLSGILMLSVSPAADKAQATKIAANLKNLKAACIMYYADNDKWPSSDITFDGNDNDTSDSSAASMLRQYLDSMPENGYKYYAPSSDEEDCAVSYSNSDIMTSGVKKRLTQMAASVALYDGKSSSADRYSGGDEVFLKVSY